ncbi:hypothetical protein [Aureispira sp. CCB-QB1]|uniref:hypothetical protein n=1 Tax=Aureispira sp. CCB-QB1 TaxID=1313421 RepID=UPI0006989D70|nr:hypothetical protein [Aureispira sp. CCB-QB1]
MKNLIILFLAAIFVISCDNDPCKDVVCGDQGTCTEGICVCTEGYEQDAAGLCNTEMRAKFIGSWVVSDTCTRSIPATYTVTTTNASSNIKNFNIVNFWDQFTGVVVAGVTSSTEFTISRQEPDNDKFFVESIGAGSISGNTITIKYVVSDETDANNIKRDTCMSTWVK